MSGKLDKGKDWFIVTLLIHQDCFSQAYYLAITVTDLVLPYFNMYHCCCFSEANASI